MKKARATWYLALCLVFLSATHSHSQSTTNSIEGLKSADYKERRQATDSLNQQRKETIEKLISLLKGDYSVDVKEAAAKSLGDYRASEAANALIQNIEFDLRGRIMISIPPEDERQPISAALEKIGTPSILIIIQTLEENDNSKVRDLLLRVLCRIEGEKDIVKLRLQKALAAQQDAKKKARLEAALQSLPGLQFGK